MSQDVLTALDSIRGQLRKRLLLVPEYRALLSIERAISEVFEIMGPNSERREAAQRRVEPLDDHDGTDPTPQAVSAVLESIAAKAVSSVAARNGMTSYAGAGRTAGAGR